MSAFLQVSAQMARWLAFNSDANNLVPDDTNGFTDIFVNDSLTHETARISVDAAGAQGNFGTSNAPSISADGRWVDVCLYG